MMSPLNLEQCKEIRKLCQTIISTSSQIHFTSVINKNGRLIESTLCNDSIITKLSPQELEMLCMQRTLQTSMGGEIDAKLGSITHTITERDSFLEIIIPFQYGIIIIISGREFQRNTMVEKILKIIKKFTSD